MGVTDIYTNPTPAAEWAAQSAWFIDPVSGHDNNGGASSGNALFTWGELRRRMKLTNGHTSATTTITILSSLASNDVMNVDWGTAAGQNAVNVVGTTTIVRSGSLTSVPTNRNPATNQMNVITDSTVTSWTSDVGLSSTHMLMPTSGAATGAPAWIIADIGSHSANVSSFYLPSTFTEYNMGNGDTYNILSFPFVQNFSHTPTSGIWTFQYLSFGNTSSTTSITASVGNSILIYQYSAYFSYGQNELGVSYNELSGTRVNFNNSQTRIPLNLYSASAAIYYAGAAGDISGFPYGEVEEGGEFIFNGGTISNGIRWSVGNKGGIRVYDAGIFNSPDFGIELAFDGWARLQTVWGNGNASYGIMIYNTARVGAFFNLGTITGVSGDISFCGAPVVWVNLASGNTEYIKGQFSATSLVNINQNDWPVFNTVNLLAPQGNVNLLNTGQKNLLNYAGGAVPTGKSLIITDIQLVVTSFTGVLATAPIVSVGTSGGSYTEWAGLTTLTGLNALNQMYSLALGSSTNPRVIFTAGQVPQINIGMAATGPTVFTTRAYVYGHLF